MKEQIRKLILSLGADVCGFARIDRFDGVRLNAASASIIVRWTKLSHIAYL
jgi:hypothetical protein